MFCGMLEWCETGIEKNKNNIERERESERDDETWMKTSVFSGDALEQLNLSRFLSCQAKQSFVFIISPYGLLTTIKTVTSARQFLRNSMGEIIFPSF